LILIKLQSTDHSLPQLRPSLYILAHLPNTFKMKWLLALLPIVAASPVNIPDYEGDIPPPGQVSIPPFLPSE
jgi:hypothetical protein